MTRAELRAEIARQQRSIRAYKANFTRVKTRLEQVQTTNTTVNTGN